MDDLRTLLALQRLDTAGDLLRHRRATLPERAALKALRSELAEVTAALAALDDHAATLAADQARREAEVEAIEAKRASLERQLARTSVPREAEVLSSEIAVLRARQGAEEDQLLELMELAEPLAPRHEELAADAASLAEREVVARAELAAAEDLIDAETAKVAEARAAALAPIDAQLLARYEKLRGRLDGVAVAELDGTRCTGCSVSLSTSEVESLRHLPADALAECAHCGRLLAR